MVTAATSLQRWVNPLNHVSRDASKTVPAMIVRHDCCYLAAITPFYPRVVMGSIHRRTLSPAIF
jgi:hypothetical protein